MPNDPIQINPVDLEDDVALGIMFPMNAPNGGGLNSTFYTKDQVKANMHLLFSTMIGERVMMPTFGTYLYNLLFEPSDTDLKEKQIRNEVDRAISTWIPIVEVVDVTFPEVVDEKFIRLSIFYRIPNFNIEDELVLQVN